LAGASRRQEGNLLSFLDEPDEPVRPRRRSPRGPSADRQTLMVRRTIALVGGLLVLILLVVGVRGCLNARNESAIEDYSDGAAELLRESKQEGVQLFELLQSAGGSDQTVDIRNTVNGYRVNSRNRVDRASDLDAPDDVQDAQRYLLEILDLRAVAMAEIADGLQVALGDQDRRVGTEQISDQMQVLLASDVVDSQRFRPELAEVLREKELSAPDLPTESFIPDLEWLQPEFVADQIEGLRTGTGGGEAAPGLHGNGLAAVTLGGTALGAGTSASVQLSEDLAFDIQVQNQGENTETDVVVKVIVGQGNDAIELTETIDTIAAGESKTVTIPLQEQPPTGQNVPVTVEVEPVPGEEKTDNNSQESTVIFTR
jgi:hypothetical protein